MGKFLKCACILSLLLFMAVPAKAVVSYTVTDLGTLGEEYSHAYGINDSGQIVGWAGGWAGISGDVAPHAFLYNGSTMTFLGTLGGTISKA
jgi:probable HAF family extracellular repeat protein